MSLAFQIAAEDSTGQRITLIVIGLLLAALALAFLTVWYYRVTDPGPSHREAKRSGPQSPRGPGSGSRTAGWKDRLSDFSLPTIPVRSAKQNPPAPQAPVQRRPASQSQPSPSPSPSPTPPETVSLEGGFYLDLTEISDSPEPVAKLGSLNKLDLRQPAPLLDPDRAPQPDSVAMPVSAPAANSAPNDGKVSFDDWLAEVEATDGP